MVIVRYRYEIGGGVWQLNKDGDFDTTIITNRKAIRDQPYYTTEALDRWTHEDFLL